MKIIFYTSTLKNAVDSYNMFRVLQEFGDKHEFSVIEVKKEKKGLPAWRVWLSEQKHGKNHLRRDHLKVFKKISDKTDYTFLATIPTYTVNEVNDDESVAHIKAIKPDLLIQCGAGILRSNVFSLPKYGTINLHHGFAPEVRGVSSILWACYYGLKVGATVHFIDDNLDTGPILSQFEYDWREKAYPEVYNNCIENGANLLVEAINKLPVNTDRINEEQVKSYYFSSFDWKNYNEFKAAGFEPVKVPLEKKSKRLPKRIFL